MSSCRSLHALRGTLLTQDPIGLAGGTNLYAYAGNDPVGFADPFGLEKVTGSKAAMGAYDRGVELMMRCAAGNGCDEGQAAAAAEGLTVLAAAEADPNVLIDLNLGTVSGNAPAVGQIRGLQATFTIDPSHGTMGSRYSLEGVVVHEVHETYERILAAGATHDPVRLGLAYPSTHARAVQQAEDSALLGASLPTRTSRSLGCNRERMPGTFASAPVCAW